MEITKIKTLLLDDIRAGLEADLLVSRFNNDCTALRLSDSAYFFQLFLCVAIEHNHTKLIALILSDVRYDPSVCFGPSSIFVLMRTRNRALVDSYLCAHSSVTTFCDNPACLSNRGMWHGLELAAQEDWFFDESEMFKLFLSFYKDHDLERYVDQMKFVCFFGTQLWTLNCSIYCLIHCMFHRLDILL